jgi:hypothetical protein
MILILSSIWLRMLDQPPIAARRSTWSGGPMA